MESESEVTGDDDLLPERRKQSKKLKCLEKDEKTRRKVQRRKCARASRSKNGVISISYSGGKRVRSRRIASSVHIEEMPSGMTTNCLNEEAVFEETFNGISDADVATLLQTLDGINFPAQQMAPKTWEERKTKNRECWDGVRSVIYEQYVARQCHSQRVCDSCSTEPLPTMAVKCQTCRKHLCWQCDFEAHSQDPFHRRSLSSGEKCQPLKPSQFFNQFWKLVEHDISVPCFLPEKCDKCSALGSLKLIPSCDKVAVITIHGRFDLQHSSFFCTECENVARATVHDYVAAGFWPGDCQVLSYLFSEDALFMWYHIHHKSPGASGTKFVNVLEEISKEYGRCSPINWPLFSIAAKEWEFNRHRISVDLKQQNKMECAPCGKKPGSGSSDANMKLKHLKSAGSVKRQKNVRENLKKEKPLYGDEAIIDDAVVEAHRQKIYSKIPRVKLKEMCGGSVFRAATVDSSKKADKYDINGLIVSACRHGTIRAALNMFHGETFTHTHFMHYLAWKLGCKFFCYDVVCRYWRFAIKVERAFPEFKPLVEAMRAFLPMMHAKAHQLPCQIFWNPHWKKGNGLTIGEEHEQVFAKLSRYATVTKHMTLANRSDHLSSAIFYWNEAKFENMPKFLRKRLNKAISLQIPQHLKDLTCLLESTGYTIGDLPAIWKDLRFQARLSLTNKLTRKTPVEKLQRTLEGIYVQMKSMQVFINTQAEHCKARNTFRGKLRKLKTKACKVIALLNGQSPTVSVTKEDFDAGHFPWDFYPGGSKGTAVSIHSKFQLVDKWMLLQRAKEEVSITKKELANYLHYIADKRAILQNLMHDQSEASSQDFVKGRRVVLNSEIDRLTEKLEEALCTFNLHSREDFENFFFTSSSSDLNEMPDEENDGACLSDTSSDEEFPESPTASIQLTRSHVNELFEISSDSSADEADSSFSTCSDNSEIESDEVKV